MRKFLLLLLIAVPAAAQSTSGAGFPPYACSANYLNQSYRDTDNNLSYKCANFSGVGYTWQMNGSPIFPVTSDPTGNSCTNGFPLLERISTGVVYSCQGGVYGAVGGGGVLPNPATSVFLDKGGAVFNAKAYGAVGNGTTDDTAAIQSTIASAVSAGGGRIVFPSGTFKLTTGPITVPSGISIEGVGPNLAATCANADLCMAPDGGTWFDCGGNASCFVNTSGGSTGQRSISMKNIGFENFTANAVQLGNATTVGLGFGVFDNVYVIGSSTLNGSDEGFVLYNLQHLQIRGLYVANVNTCLDINGTGAGGMVPGNSEVSGVYCFSYTKSAANGNSSKPGISVTGSNLIDFIRPQVNNYARTGMGSPDWTADGILVNGSNRLSFYGIDIEGECAHSINFINAKNNYVSVAFGNSGAHVGAYTAALDATSLYNVLVSMDGTANATVDAAARSYNEFLGMWGFTAGSEANGLTTNPSITPGLFYLSSLTSFSNAQFNASPAFYFDSNSLQGQSLTQFIVPVIHITAGTGRGIGLSYVASDSSNGNVVQDFDVPTNNLSAVYRFFLAGTEKWQFGYGGQSNDNFSFYDATVARRVINLPTGMPANSYSGDANGANFGAAVTIPGIKATTGTRYVCVDTNGKLVSQTTACSGT